MPPRWSSPASEIEAGEVFAEVEKGPLLSSSTGSR